MNPSELIAEITAAFKDEPYPGDANIVCDNPDVHLACIDVWNAFKGHRWQEVPDDVLSTERAGLSCMSKEGFQYYLPAFLCSLLKNSSVVTEGLGMVVLLLNLPAELDPAVLAERIQRFEADGKPPGVGLHEVLQQQLVHTNTEINAFIARASQFTPAQGQAVQHFLAYSRDGCGDEFLSTQADLAIHRYWFQFA